MAQRLHKTALSKEGWAVAKKIGDIASTLGATLAGGTALALRLGHRVSNDLDFFMEREFEIEPIIRAVEEKGTNYRVVSEGSGTLVLEVEGVKVSFLRYEYPFMDTVLEAEGLRLAGVLDIAAMKVIAISQRGTRRDFVDLYEILRTTPFHLIASHMVRRFGRKRLNPLNIGKSLVYFADADSNPDPSYLEGKAVKWDKVRKFYRSHVRQFVYDLNGALGK